MAEGLEKLEDMIVRAAETTATHVQAAKTAMGAEPTQFAGPAQGQSDSLCRSSQASDSTSR